MVPEKKLRIIESKIRSDCIDCGGDGCLTCKKKIARIKMYDKANIPMDYWMLAFKNFEGDQNFKKLVAENLVDINKMYENGTSLAFVGNLGTGKTYAACCILKTAVVSGYSCRYINMADVVSELIANNQGSSYLESLINIDFLVIDEFDKRWVFPSEKSEQLFGQTLEHVLRCRFQNHMPTILCSNTENIDEVLSEDFSRAFSSLRSKYMKVIYVAGRDFRKK